VNADILACFERSPVAQARDIDGQWMGWIRDSRGFSRAKRRGM